MENRPDESKFVILLGAHGHRVLQAKEECPVQTTAPARQVKIGLTFYRLEERKLQCSVNIALVLLDA